MSEDYVPEGGGGGVGRVHCLTSTEGDTHALHTKLERWHGPNIAWPSCPINSKLARIPAGPFP
jgi:hypothetical protein